MKLAILYLPKGTHSLPGLGGGFDKPERTLVIAKARGSRQFAFEGLRAEVCAQYG
jgi:hypothetical protein